MTTQRNAVLAAILLAGTAAAGFVPAFAQNHPGGTADVPAHARLHGTHHLLPGQLIDGRIAFLKAELKITPAQDGEWQQVATAMRDNASALDRAVTTARQSARTLNAVQRLEQHEQFSKLRADNAARFLAAFKPLYASLSAEQQQMANQLMASRHFEHHHRA